MLPARACLPSSVSLFWICSLARVLFFWNCWNCWQQRLMLLNHCVAKFSFYRWGRSSFSLSIRTHTHTLLWPYSNPSYSLNQVSPWQRVMVFGGFPRVLILNPATHCCLSVIISAEKDDDNLVLCHHWNRGLLLSLQLLLMKGLTPVSLLFCYRVGSILLEWFDGTEREKNSFWFPCFAPPSVFLHKE